MRVPPHRRSVLRLLAGTGPSLSVLFPGVARPQQAPRDQGIGGTGMMRTDPSPERPLGEGDRGIGGTGVIGTIRGFGSIVVNGLRIAYPAEVVVTVDGEAAKVGDLRIGQVVQAVAARAAVRPDGSDGGLVTGRIDVVTEVVGPVEAVAPGRLVVLGQRVFTAGLTGEWALGGRVAVSGLRRPDGIIVASLIEPRSPGPDRVVGPVRRGERGMAMIGNLRLEGVGVPPPGKRVLVVGQSANGDLRVTNSAFAGYPFPPGLRQVSIEAYVGRVGAGIELGSGIAVAGRADASIPRTGSVRAVLTARVARDDGLTVERLRTEDGAAPAEPPRDIPRFERDHLDPRGLPDSPLDVEPGGEPRVFRIDPRTGSDDASGAGGFSDPSGSSGTGGQSGRGTPGGGGPPGAGGAGPGGPGGPGGLGGPGGMGGPGRPR
ncbi:DUF5666 domain-containing protein [Methylobacterium sp. E-005]|uniref:DUF5666 domain-containing protein n=1 Tax=Methylobacterium sp. E-005 TaxID=2836549 RepID=UPI001FB94113|nr:DUF5666 domain-containing protein [Methylobacterium sp. E-005]MCJ2088117.1 DUF5666 domain-containing protein [Methylobacterium sp. E-005]